MSAHNDTVRSFPSQADHERAWRDLAREIAARGDTVTEAEPLAQAAGQGELTVIGSGIETVGFTLGDDELLRQADKVFYCVADPATVVWIKRLRPDAFDLYVLYNDDKPRYVTYMQMAEAMLHHVRLGQRVVCVFYGHPGVFVLSTHRAVLIARREGHRATMRPGVCALDCLCADLGVDPCHPGMQTHEATDMLVRGRKPDTSLHVVLWQVGLIGEMGFRREGYINKNFSVLVEYLQKAYSDDYPITHYVASRYPTIPPLIETYKLKDLHDPAIQLRITGLSTFYLAPRDATQADAAMVERLGLLKPGQILKTPVGALREIGAYGARERKAFEDFAKFEVPPDYHWQEDTEASRFLIELRKDGALRQAYAADPVKAFSDPRFARLSASERRLLATRDSGAIQIAAKGIHRREASNHQLITALLHDRSACADLLRKRRAGGGAEKAWLSAYAQNRKFSYSEETLRIDLTHVRRHALTPWSGVYAAHGEELAITVLASNAGDGGLLYVNDRRIPSFAFKRGVLEWRAAAGNPSNGFLRFEARRSGRRILGQIWGIAEERPDQRYFEAAEVDPDRANLAPRAGRFLRGEDPAALEGRYMLRVGAGRGRRRVPLEIFGDVVKVSGVPVRVERRWPGRLAWADGPADFERGEIDFLSNPFTDLPEVHGHVIAASQQRSVCFGRRTGAAPRHCAPANTTVPEWVARQLAAICTSENGGAPPFLWQKWEKHHLTSRVVNSLVGTSERRSA